MYQPIRRTGSGATGTQNALVETVELLALSDGLEVLTTVCRGVLALQVRLNRLVLLVELGHVRNKVLDDISVGERVYLDGCGSGGINAAYA